MSIASYIAARPALLPYLTDQVLARAVLALGARLRGNTFRLMEMTT